MATIRRIEKRSKYRWMAVLGTSMFLCAAVQAGPLEFSLHRVTGEEPGPTVLVIGGIQGDEPGGFNAASLLTTHYHLKRGTLWVVPNLNFESIVRRSRGVHGDMNRKFPAVPSRDPDHARVERIKGIITDAQVDYVLNLHDGSGFFRLHHQDRQRNPARWGQSIIIDQESMDRSPYAPLGGLARAVSDRVNTALVEREHRFHVKNTRTREGNREMAKTLTFFAINQGKPAVGLEASKSLPTHLRVYYHLQMVEGYLAELGIEFERGFSLDPEAVREAVNGNLQVAFYGRRLVLDLADARETLRYIPMKKGEAVVYEASNPLVAVVDAGGSYKVSYGNRRVTRIQPAFFEYDASIENVSMAIDGVPRSVKVGSVVEVEEHFTVHAPRDVRVNVIGWRQPGGGSEEDTKIHRHRISPDFSVDQAGRIYRVELYRGARFAGMVLVRFGEEPKAASRLSDSGPFT